MHPTCECEHPMCTRHPPFECEATAFVNRDSVALCTACAILADEYESRECDAV